MAQTSKPSNQHKENSFFGYLQIAIVVGVVIIALVLARSPERIERSVATSAGAQNVEPLGVSVLAVPTQQRITLPIEITGNVSIEETILVSTEVRGRVEWVSDRFRHGETIAANEVFIKIDPTEYELQVKEIEAKLQLRRMQLDKAVYDQQSSANEVASRIELLETQLQLAKRKLAQTEISLPYELNVTRADTEVGELVGPFEYVGPDASVLGRGYRTEDILVTGPVEPERIRDLTLLPGRPAKIAVADKQYTATLERTSNVIALETRMMRLFFEFTEDIPSASLPLPGSFAEISLEGASYDNVFVLPLQTLQSHLTAWVVDKGVLAERTPKTLALTKEYWIVEPFNVADGLVAGNYPGAFVGMDVKVNSLN